MPFGDRSQTVNAPATVSAAAWLEAWELATSLGPGRRESALLQPACQMDVDALDRLPIGTRDGLLLDLRQALFGPQMQCTAVCPQCGERCEWSCSVDAFRPATPGLMAPSGSWTDGTWQVHLRAVSGLDLAAAQRLPDEAQAARHMLLRCVVSASRDGLDVSAHDLPESVLSALDETLTQLDPHAAPTISLMCPACETHWDTAFDAGAFLWTELDAWAQRTLGEVHLLACRYGWSERDILNLPPSRRARYLSMVDE